MSKKPVFAAIIFALTCPHASAWAGDPRTGASERGYETNALGVATLAAGLTNITVGAVGMRAGEQKKKALKELSIQHGTKRVQAELADLRKDLSKPGDQVTLAGSAKSSNALSDFEVKRAIAKLRATSNPGESHKLIVTQVLPNNSKVDRILVGDCDALSSQLAKLKIENASLSRIVEDKLTSAERSARVQAWRYSFERTKLLEVAKREGKIARELNEAAEQAYKKAFRTFSPNTALGIVGTVAGIVDLMVTPHSIKATAQYQSNSESAARAPSGTDAASAAR